MHNFVYLAQRRSQEFSCEPNLGGGGVSSRPSPWLRQSVAFLSVSLGRLHTCCAETMLLHLAYARRPITRANLQQQQLQVGGWQ